MAIIGPGNSTSYVATPFGITRQGLRSFTIFHWFRNNNTSGAAAFSASGAGFFNSAQNWEFKSDVTLTAWYADEEDSAGADNYATETLTFPIATWLPIMITGKSDGSRYAYDVTTGVTTSNATSGVLTTPYTHFGVGYTPAVDSASGFLWDATSSIAEVAVWNGELTQAEFLKLKSGANPMTIRRDTLILYYPLTGDLTDYGPMHLSMQAYGTNANYTWGDHPPVQPRPKTRIVRTASTVAISPSSYTYMSYPW